MLGLAGLRTLREVERSVRVARLARVEVFFVGLLVIVGLGIACVASLAVYRLYRAQV